MACLENLIYLLSQNSKLILAFDVEFPFGLQKGIPLPQVARPRDLAACETHNCLYGVDDRSKCIWKIRPTSPDVTVNLWLTGIDSPFKISVTKDGCVLIPRDDKPRVLDLMGSDARLEKSITLPDVIKHVQHAIQSPSETFFISYGRKKARITDLWKYLWKDVF